MEPIKVFFLEPTGRIDRRLRRYHSDDRAAKCPASGWIHDADVFLDIVPKGEGEPKADRWPHDDPRWPKACACGYVFTPEDAWQLFCEEVYRRVDTGEEMRLRDAPAGAMYYADWRLKYNPQIAGPDGHFLYVVVPDANGHHQWGVDDEARNCTRKGDKSHKCWCRHGDPRTGNVHVDKNGNTCAAGAGSILTDGWHGFLHNGFLVTA